MTKKITKITLIAVIYYCLFQFGRILAISPGNVSPIWPASGFALAALLMLGYNVWPGLFIAEFIANWSAIASGADSSSLLTSGTASFMMSSGVILQTVTAAYLVKRFIDLEDLFDSTENILNFVCIILLSVVISATFGVSGLYLFGYLSAANYLYTWGTWLIGDLFGILLITPTIIMLSKISWKKYTIKLIAEPFLFLTVLSFVAWIIFLQPVKINMVQFPYILILFVIWAAFRFQEKGVMPALIIISSIAIFGTVNSSSPFAQSSLNTSLLLLQSFIGIISLTGLTLTAAINKQRKAENRIQKLAEELEDKVRRRTAQLEAAYREQEAFSYSISHDLRAPLRAIDGFAAILRESCGNHLDVEARNCLNRILVNTRNMEQLVDGLLNFSRISRKEITLETINIKELACEILKELITDESGKKCKIIIGELPAVMGDSIMIRQVLMNLLSNAIKYSSNRDEPIIELGFLGGEKKAYFVKDNGVGFDMAYSNKLFKVFNRLHNKEDFEGNGVGLAIVARIVEKHGGRVWAEAVEGKGAVFYFTLS